MSTMDNKTEQFKDETFYISEAEYNRLREEKAELKENLEAALAMNKLYRDTKLKAYCSRGDKELRDVNSQLYDLVFSKPLNNVREVGNYGYCEYKVLIFILAFAIGFTIGTVIIRSFK